MVKLETERTAIIYVCVDVYSHTQRSLKSSKLYREKRVIDEHFYYGKILPLHIRWEKLADFRLNFCAGEVYRNTRDVWQI